MDNTELAIPNTQVELPQEQNLIPQQRLDEVVAKQREAERRAQEMEQQVLALNVKLAEQAAMASAQVLQLQQTQKPVQVDPFADLRQTNPELANALDAQKRQIEDQQRQQFQQLSAHTRQLELKLALTRVPNATPELSAAAEKYMRQWTAAGVPATAEDVLKFAMGELALNGKLPAPAAPSPVNPATYAPPNPVLTQSNPQALPSNPQAKLPANFNQLSAEQQEAYYDRLYGDIPL